MDNLSFHITDITANSIRAKASDIEIDIQIKDTSICIRIADNGCGMDPETVSLIRNPFYTHDTKSGSRVTFLDTKRGANRRECGNIFHTGKRYGSCCLFCLISY